jgi:hypothetical protein
MYERDVSYIKRCQNYAFDVSVVNPAIDNRIAQMGRVYEGMVIAPSCPGPKCRKIPQLAPLALSSGGVGKIMMSA